MIDASAHEAAAPSQPARDEPSWPALGRALLAGIAGALRERLHLAALESQQFVHAAGRLLAFGVAAAVLALTAWFIVVAAVIALLVHAGMALPWALVIGGALNALAAAWAWFAMRRQLASMGFPATLRSLHFLPATAAPAAGGPKPNAQPNAQLDGSSQAAASARAVASAAEPPARDVERGAAP